MMHRLSDEIMKQTALITGAASGLGFEFARLLAKEGYHLILADKNGTALHKAAEDIRSQHYQDVKTITIDLTEDNAAIRLIEMAGPGRIDILINNAGFGLFGPFFTSDWHIESGMIRLHILNLTHLTKLVVQRMVESGQGKVLNISSMAGFQPGPLFSVYAASKAYINSFSQSLSNELKDKGVTVTLLCPGQTRTGFASEVARISGSKLSKVPFTAHATDVARFGLEAMKKGKAVAIPGFTNKVTALLSKLLPSGMTTRINRNMQERIRR